MDFWIDLETYSELDLRKVGSYKYASSCEILLISFATGNQPVRVLDMTDLDEGLYEEFVREVQACAVVKAHNGMLFDRVVLLESPLFRRLFQGKQWYDTMVKAYSHSLPGALGDLSEVFALSEDKAKDKRGKELVRLFCKPRPQGSKICRATRKTHPQQWGEFIEYARRDIVAMRKLDELIPSWNCTDEESSFQMMDLRMNDRGFCVDTRLCEKAVKALLAEKQERNSEISDATAGAIGAATQRDKLLAYLLGHYGISLPDMQASTIERRIDDPDVPEPVKELLILRQQSTKTSTAKYQRMVEYAGSDFRARGTMQFHGAKRTGRQGGRGIQPHNFPRPSFRPGEVMIGIEALKGGILGDLYESVVPILSTMIRYAIVAGPGKKLIVADESSIEGRGLAWLANEEWKLQAYRDVDRGVGHDMYIRAYSTAFNADPDSVTPYQRKLGKVLELAYGYAGGIGAAITFAGGYGINLDEAAENAYPTLDGGCLDAAKRYYDFSVTIDRTYGLPEKTFVVWDAIKRMWRAANLNIVGFWKDVEKAFRSAYYDKDRVFCLGHGLTIERKGAWIRIRLPSGRYMCYPGVRISDADESISYLGENPYAKGGRWSRISTHGGKLVENITQAMCYDYFFHGLRRAEMEGYDPVLTVHDEGVAETPDTPEYSVDEFCGLISEPPPWAPLFPGNAKGFEAYRYRKED